MGHQPPPPNVITFKGGRRAISNWLRKESEKWCGGLVALQQEKEEPERKDYDMSPNDVTRRIQIRAMKVAATDGQLSVLKYMREKLFYVWDDEVAAAAAEHGHVDCLKYIHEAGGPWDEETPMRAAARGRLDCLEYSVSHGCAVDTMALFLAAINGHLDCMKFINVTAQVWDSKSTIQWAAAGGDAKCVEYAYVNSGFYADPAALYFAAKMGHIDCVMYLFLCGKRRSIVDAGRVDSRYKKYVQVAYEHGHYLCADMIDMFLDKYCGSSD